MHYSKQSIAELRDRKEYVLKSIGKLKAKLDGGQLTPERVAAVTNKMHSEQTKLRWVNSYITKAEVK